MKVLVSMFTRVAFDVRGYFGKTLLGLEILAIERGC
ncbi:MAG: hypothetical protein ACJAVI_001281 [Candidatus Azotimanducaceae bacterium]|jgi:hypothetical protein